MNVKMRKIRKDQNKREGNGRFNQERSKKEKMRSDRRRRAVGGSKKQKSKARSRLSKGKARSRHIMSEAMQGAGWKSEIEMKLPHNGF